MHARPPSKASRFHDLQPRHHLQLRLGCVLMAASLAAAACAGIKTEGSGTGGRGGSSAITGGGGAGGLPPKPTTSGAGGTGPAAQTGVCKNLQCRQNSCVAGACVATKCPAGG